MSSAKTFLKSRLDDRQTSGTYRILKPENTLVDFCSNDYLGFACSADLKDNIAAEINAHPQTLNGSTGSRLITGNLAYTEELEKHIAGFHGYEAGLLFNSGYDANLGLLSSLAQRGDTIILDELIHASVIDGARLSYANRYSFKHNDTDALEAKLKQSKGNCYVVVESIYSMDGDSAPLPEIVKLTQQYGASLIVDEAHAIGTYKKGMLYELGLQHQVFATVVTFGKALGCHGAIVMGDDLLRDYLINFSRSFIYTTAAPFHNIAAIKAGYHYLNNADEEIISLKKNIALFKSLINLKDNVELINSESPIQCIILKSNDKARAAAKILQDNGLDVRPIFSPTVAAGTERLRICLHSFNTINNITLLAKTINNL